MAWTDERIQLLKQYWDEGRSASQIAELLGEGLSRNAVIGKAHRLGLSSRPSPLKTGDAKSSAKPAARSGRKVAEKVVGDAAPAAFEPAPAKTPVSEPAAGPRREPEVAAPAPAAAAAAADPVVPLRPPVASKPTSTRPAKGGKVTLLDLNDRICRWPIGHPDESDFHFCGRPVSPGFPYCGDHCLLAYQAQMPRKDRPAGPPRPFGPNLPRPR